jgi:uncharacterized OB-fold protein
MVLVVFFVGVHVKRASFDDERHVVVALIRVDSADDAVRTLAFSFKHRSSPSPRFLGDEVG